MAHSHQASCFALCQTTNVPPPHTTAGLHSHRPSPNRAEAQLPPLLTSSNRNTAHTLLYVIVKRCLQCGTTETNTENATVTLQTLWLWSNFVDRQPQLLLNDCREECLRGCRPCPHCIGLYCVKVRLFQPSRG